MQRTKRSELWSPFCHLSNLMGLGKAFTKWERLFNHLVCFKFLLWAGLVLSKRYHEYISMIQSFLSDRVGLNDFLRSFQSRQTYDSTMSHASHFLFPFQNPLGNKEEKVRSTLWGQVLPRCLKPDKAISIESPRRRVGMSCPFILPYFLTFPITILNPSHRSLKKRD